MILVVLAIFWVILLAPIVIRYFRDGDADKSIESFHAEHDVLSRQGYAVAPAHRLDEFEVERRENSSMQSRPRLTVVHADDTFGSLESRSSWDEWSDDYEYEADSRSHVDSRSHAVAQSNRYAQAYASRPSASPVVNAYEPPLRRRTMRAQRRIVFSRLVLAAFVLTILALVVGSSIILDLAALSWFGVVAFVALALYSVSQGYLLDTSLPLLSKRTRLATVAPLYGYAQESADERYESSYDGEVFEPDVDEEWARQFPRYRALG
ncbi:MAG: hypothetical protein ACYCPT_12005 [Acidimicrobiales bacterium]